MPQNSAEKKQFKQSVRELARGSHEENMLEAYTQAHVAYAEYKVLLIVRFDLIDVIYFISFDGLDSKRCGDDIEFGTSTIR